MKDRDGISHCNECGRLVSDDENCCDDCRKEYLRIKQEDVNTFINNPILG